MFAKSSFPQLRKITSGQGVDVVIEAVGSPQTTEQAIQMAKKGGIVNILGVADTKAFSQIKPFDIYFRELTVVGTYAVTLDTFNRAAKLLASGRLGIDYLLTEELSLYEPEKGYWNDEEKEGFKETNCYGKRVRLNFSIFSNGLHKKTWLDSIYG